jgi:hypothetical protein
MIARAVVQLHSGEQMQCVNLLVKVKQGGHHGSSILWQDKGGKCKIV